MASKKSSRPAKTQGLSRLLGLDLHTARLDRTYPAGSIGVISADLARYASFAAALCGVKFPYGTDIVWRRGCDIVSSCNELVNQFTGDWLWIMGDDHVFDTNVLLRLLSRMYDDGCDLVAPLCMSRQAPFPTVVGAINEVEKRIDNTPIQLLNGLQKIDVVGSAGLLVRRKVFNAVVKPVFEAGSLVRTGLGEDWWFCKKAKDAGFQLYIDTDIVIGHTTSMVVWPHKAGEAQGARLELGGIEVIIKHDLSAVPV